MLTSPLLASRVTPDRRVATQHLYAQLEPGLLTRALYPKLSSYLSFDREEHPQLYLQKKAVNWDQPYGAPDKDRLYILDTLHEILVLCSAPESRTEVAFPPHQDCILKQKVNRCTSTVWLFSRPSQCRKQSLVLCCEPCSAITETVLQVVPNRLHYSRTFISTRNLILFLSLFSDPMHSRWLN